MRHGCFDPLIQRPAIQRQNAALQLLMPFRGGGQRFKFRDQFQRPPRPAADIASHVQRRLQSKVLRQITHHQVAPGRDFAAIGRLQAGQDSQERGLAAAVASDQSDAVAFVQTQCGAVQDRPLVVAEDQIGGGEDGGHARLMSNRIPAPSRNQSGRILGARPEGTGGRSTGSSARNSGFGCQH